MLAGFAAAHTVPGHSLCRPDCAAACTAWREDALQCQSQAGCRWVASAVGEAGGSACLDDRGELWLQWAVALAQWSYAAGLGATVCQTWRPSRWVVNLSAITLSWALCFGAVLGLALSGSADAEFALAGPLLVGCACMVRFLDGFVEVMLYRYIAVRWPAEKTIVTICLGLTEKVVGVIFAALVGLLVEAGFFPA